WPSFPITLNHIINLALFLLSPWSRSIVAWVVFSLANIYVDMVYAYPIFPFQVRMRVGAPIQVPKLAIGGLSAKQRVDVYRAIHAEVERSLAAMLEELDSSRPWVRASRWVIRLRRRAVASPPSGSGHEAAHVPGGS